MEQKREGTKNLKREGQVGSQGGCQGAGTPLRTMSSLKKHNEVLHSDFVLSEIEFEIGTHHLPSPNKKYSQQFRLESH